jgi:hypothetical protein
MKLAQHIAPKKLIFAAFMAVVVITMVIVLSPSPQPQVFGNLSPQDISEVTRRVRAQMREQQEPLLPDLSWDSIRWLPAGIRQRWSERIISIRAGSNETVKATTGVQHGLMSMSQYNLKKTAKGWEIADIVSSGGFVAAPSNSQ